MVKIKNQIVLLLILASSALVFGQNQEALIYNPNADAFAQIAEAAKKAKAENKHILVQVGGNWCSWCIRLHKFYSEDTQLDSALKANYVPVLLNYSKENKNEAILATFGFPQRFGFPVLLILDSNGNRIHTQSSVYLEEGKGYNKDKLLGFFRDWSPAALNPDNYQKKK